MTDLPASGYWSDNSRTEGEQKQWGEDIRDVINELLGGGPEQGLTISSGSVTPSRAIMSIDTEASASSDTLDAIAQDNHPEGRTILVRAANTSRTVTVNHNAGVSGAILLQSNSDVDLEADRYLWLYRSGTTWVELSHLDTSFGDDLVYEGGSNSTSSGTFVEWTDIPSWVNEIILEFSFVSTDGSNGVTITLGDSGGVETTGYEGAVSKDDGTSASFSGSFVVSNSNDAAVQRTGLLLLRNRSANQWVISGIIADTGASTNWMLAGTKSLSDTLDRLRVSATGGDTFDGGAVKLTGRRI